MPDNKTVTFDAETQQVVPKVPSVGMQDGAEALFLNMAINPADSESRTAFVKALWSFMLAAAPTPAAQSAGQEAVRYFVFDGDCTYNEFKTDAERREAHRSAIDGYFEGEFWREEAKSVVSGIVTHKTVQNGDEFEPKALYAAPVNGGERAKPAPLYLTGWQLLEALDLIAPDRNTDKEQLDGEAALQYGDETCHSGAGVYCWLAEEPSEGSTILLGEPDEDTQQPAKMPQPVPANAVWTRHGSGDCEWWDYGSWKAHKRGGIWVLTAYGKEISRAIDLQRVMAFASQAKGDAL